MLAAGGSAADAAVAMMLVSCSAETIFTGLGGGGFAVHHDAARQETRCVDFFVSVPGLDGTGPGPGTPIEVTFIGQQMSYDIGPPTVAVPGLPAGAHYLWRRWGRLPWADLVAPGLQASYGTELSIAHATVLPRIEAAMRVGEGVEMYSRPDGGLVRGGDTVVHHDHHRAYELLTTDPAAFYRGSYATALVASCRAGGALSMADLASYRVVEFEPQWVDVHGYSVLARGDDLDDVLRTVGRAAATMRADPLTDPAAARALVVALRGPDRRAETTNVVAVDAQGNGCVITTTLGLGSGVWVPGFGVHLNSMLGEGELIRDALLPGVRMGSMMSPLAAVDPQGRLTLMAGAAGGSRIRPALTQSLLRMLDQAAPQAAIEAPRLTALPRGDPAEPGLVRMEPGFAPEVVSALLDSGEEVRVADGLDAYFGGVSAVSTLGGGADPRRGGAVVML